MPSTENKADGTQTQTSSADEVDFKIVLAQKRFLYKTPGVPGVDREQLKAEILETIFANDMAPMYEFTCSELGWPVDQDKLTSMQEKNKEELVQLEDKIKDAEENLGDVEVREALQAKADYLCKIGDKARAEEAYRVTEEKTAGVGPKLDIAFSMLRLDIATGDWHAVKLNIAKAKQLTEEGGDWERKNRLKVYQALLGLYTRSFQHAAELFLDSIATFTTTELFSYETSIFYTVLTAIISLDRVNLKKKVVDAPEILTVIDAIPNLSLFLNSLYSCKYKDFYRALAGLTDQIKRDMYLEPHFKYFLREVRVVAYAQFLESYKSVTLQSMATAFGVSVDFLDAELADFIVAGRLSAKIDKVAGIIETNRPDAKNAQYQQSIKQGDILLNRLQKLSKVIDLE